MIPYEALSGFDEAPTIAIVDAPVRRRLRSSSDGLWWDIDKLCSRPAAAPINTRPMSSRTNKDAYFAACAIFVALGGVTVIPSSRSPVIPVAAARLYLLMSLI